MSKSTIWVAIGVALLTSGCRGEVAHKRLPLGFQGMRGKKSIDFTAQDEDNSPLNELERVSYQPLPILDELSRYAAIQDPWNLARIHNNFYGQGNQLPSYKRAPMGFMGMRGKKENDLNLGSLYPPQPLEDYLNAEFPEKRVGLKGFQGMRGKKQYEYLRNKFFNKRRSMGFQGMRGKKSNIGEDPLNLYGDLIDTSSNDFKNYLTDNEIPMQNYAPDREYFDDDLMDKRGGGLKGFQGMRGKREFEYMNSVEEKRAPSGFQGMRGKKDEVGEEHAKTDDPKDFEAKPTSISTENALGMQEVATNGILPPTDSNEQVSLLDNFGIADQEGSNMVGAISVKERRSPNYGFYGVRGKKMPSANTFYGMRGKKGPYGFPFRGKFVGVRGKKSEIQHLAERLSWTGDDTYQKRRGPSGFVGMRGKKSITPGNIISIIFVGFCLSLIIYSCHLKYFYYNF